MGSGRRLTMSFEFGLRRAPRARLRKAILRDTSPGTTGFDVVDSWGWLRVEVPGGLVKHPGNK